MLRSGSTLYVCSTLGSLCASNTALGVVYFTPYVE